MANSTLAIIARLTPPVAIPLLLLPAVLMTLGLSRGMTSFAGLKGSPACEMTQTCPRDARNAILPVPPALPGREAVPLDILEKTPPDMARALNAKAPLFKGLAIPARPFEFAGSADDRARAVECLAAAQLYEAGSNEADQKAVAQAVLNRVRHPAYPHTVCGVVFEGSQRTTGCQFTFTCDGSLARRYSDAAWARARSLAERMLDGEVDKRVGWATHYHTDWVYPYWSPSLDKVAAVNTHLFFKWRGTWGAGPAFSSGYVGKEPLITRLHHGIDDVPTSAEARADAAPAFDTSPGPPLADAPLPTGLTPGALGGNSLKVSYPDGGFGLLLGPDSSADEVVIAALRLCFGQEICRVLGWSSPSDMPRGFSVPAASLAKLSFSYVRNADMPIHQFRFDCERFTKVKKTQCLAR